MKGGGTGMNNTMYPENDYSKMVIVGEIPDRVSCNQQYRQLEKAIKGVKLTAYNVGTVLHEAKKRVSVT